ncbi:MAG: hypothetical protein OER97_03955 [Gammaproteobacteria bacterium]|nr:hypothetical protein [Gammaproteobacteria bacterium]
MRILQHFHTAEEAEDVGRELEERGIATFVSGKNEEWAGGPISGPSGAALCVIVERQYNDAIMWLKNPDHEVQVKLSPSEISDIRSSLQPKNSVRAMLPALIKLLILVGMFAIAVKFLIMYSDAA